MDEFPKSFWIFVVLEFDCVFGLFGG